MRHVAETTGQDLEQLYTQIGWPLYKMYGHAFEAFKQMVQDPEPIFARLQVCIITVAPVLRTSALQSLNVNYDCGGWAAQVLLPFWPCCVSCSQSH